MEQLASVASKVSCSSKFMTLQSYESLILQLPNWQGTPGALATLPKAWTPLEGSGVCVYVYVCD